MPGTQTPARVGTSPHGTAADRGHHHLTHAVQRRRHCNGPWHRPDDRCRGTCRCTWEGVGANSPASERSHYRVELLRSGRLGRTEASIEQGRDSGTLPVSAAGPHDGLRAVTSLHELWKCRQRWRWHCAARISDLAQWVGASGRSPRAPALRSQAQRDVGGHTASSLAPKYLGENGSGESTCKQA